MSASEDRRREIEDRLAAVEERIASACRAARRHRSHVTLVVVTKFFPSSDVRVLAELGVRDVGENRHQEAAAKREECATLPLRWHFIGQLQSNKAAAVGGWADVVQSVDRARLLQALSLAAARRGSALDVLVQVSLDDHGSADGRGGVAAERTAELAAQVAATEGLQLRGLMGVAPLGGDPAVAFGKLATLGAQLRERFPSASWLSAGMSADLEVAVAAGATHVRVGSAVLGNRPTPR